MEYISPDFEVFEGGFLDILKSHENELPTMPI